MITAREGMLQAILDDPGNDELRLVYADMLEEDGDEERATFIRLQIAIAQEQEHCSCGICVRRRHGGGQCTNGPCAGDQLRMKIDGKMQRVNLMERELLEKAKNWPMLTGVIFFNAEWVFRRGFVDEVRCSLADWMEHGPAIVRHQPVTKVALNDKEPYFYRGDFWWNGLTRSSTLPLCLTSMFGEKTELLTTKRVAEEFLSSACLLWAKSQPV